MDDSIKWHLPFGLMTAEEIVEHILDSCADCESKTGVRPITISFYDPIKDETVSRKIDELIDDIRENYPRAGRKAER